MFQLVSSDTMLLTTPSAWSEASIRQATRAMGWSGMVRGPVDFRGVSFVAVCGSTDFGAPGSGWLVGCLIPASDPETAMQDASLLAGYSARAILIRSGEDLLEIKLQTALLDQGAVVEGDGQVTMVSTPGPVVPSPLQDTNSWRTDERWYEMYQAITTAPAIGYVS